MKRLIWLLLLAVPGYAADDLLVAAAADLTPLQSALTDGFHRAAGANVRFTFASSGQLSQQIDNGAPYDVFLSANEKFATDGARAGYLDAASVRTYALGRIALWSRAGNIRTLDQLKDASVLHIAIANPEFAPYGVAARQALEKSGLWSTLQSKILYGENIRQTLQYAETGNADAAIVAWSLVYDRGGILLPADLHQPIRQAAAVVRSSKQPVLAGRFLDFLASPAGHAILQSHGLMPGR